MKPIGSQFSHKNTFRKGTPLRMTIAPKGMGGDRKGVPLRNDHRAEGDGGRPQGCALTE
jgi:hypothetical protein